MATTRKSTRKKTVKIVFWRKEVEKIDRPFRKKFDALFKAFDREKKKLGITTTADNNRLWNEKYQPKYNSIERQLDNRLNKLWLKYHTSLSSTALADAKIHFSVYNDRDLRKSDGCTIYKVNNDEATESVYFFHYYPNRKKKLVFKKTPKLRWK